MKTGVSLRTGISTVLLLGPVLATWIVEVHTSWVEITGNRHWVRTRVVWRETDVTEVMVTQEIWESKWAEKTVLKKDLEGSAIENFGSKKDSRAWIRKLLERRCTAAAVWHWVNNIFIQSRRLRPQVHHLWHPLLQNLQRNLRLHSGSNEIGQFFMLYRIG